MNNPLYFAANLSITLTNLLRQSFSLLIILLPPSFLCPQSFLLPPSFCPDIHRDCFGICPLPSQTSAVISFSPSIIPAPSVMLSRYTSGLFQHPAITLSNLLRQSFSPPIIPASTVIPASSVIPANAGISLDVRSLPEGTYLLQIKDRNKSILKTERTVIVR